MRMRALRKRMKAPLVMIPWRMACDSTNGTNQGSGIGCVARCRAPHEPPWSSPQPCCRLKPTATLSTHGCFFLLYSTLTPAAESYALKFQIETVCLVTAGRLAMAGKKQLMKETTELMTGPKTGLLTSRLFSFSIENEQCRTDDK